MAYGLKIQNPSGGLVIDSEGFGMNYIGTASYFGTTPYSQPGISQAAIEAYTYGAPINISEYRITSTASQLLPLLTISASYVCALVSVQKINSNTWSIKAYSSAAGLQIYCFAKTSVTPTNYGLALYDSGGNVSYNFSNAGSPLFFKSIASFPDDSINQSPVSSASITGASLNSYTKPIVFGWNLGYQFYVGPGTPDPPQEINTWQYIASSAAGLTIVSGNLRRSLFTIVPPSNFDAGTDVPIADSDFPLPATTVVIMEANGLVT
jgi:hypothetical protein